MRDPDDATTPVPSADELERAIASVTGVSTAEVTPTATGRDRLRISLRPGEDPEAVAWTVAATLRERFGIALDPAAITARVVTEPAAADAPAATEPDPPPAPPPTAPPPPAPPPAAPPSASPPPASPPAAPAPAPSAGLIGDVRHALADRPAGADPRRRRAAIRELVALPDGDALEVAATLRLEGREVVGHARGLRTRRGRWRAIAEATLAAVGDLAGGRVRGHVDHVTVLTFADLAHVSVSVTLLTERGEETFLGAALVRDDPDRAVMRAALDAVNRRIEPWLEGTVADAG